MGKCSKAGQTAGLGKKAALGDCTDGRAFLPVELEG